METPTQPAGNRIRAGVKSSEPDPVRLLHIPWPWPIRNWQQSTKLPAFVAFLLSLGFDSFGKLDGVVGQLLLVVGLFWGGVWLCRFIARDDRQLLVDFVAKATNALHGS